MQYIPELVINDNATHNATIIWLHGLGASQTDFVPVAEVLAPMFANLKFVFPQAPNLPVSINNNFVMPAWFDIYDLGDETKINLEQLQINARYIKSLVEKELGKGVSPENIFLAGFSQGAAIVLDCLFCQMNLKIGGLFCLSGFSPSFANNLKINELSAQTKVYQMHGIDDNVLPLLMAEKVKNYLIKHKVKVDYYTYKMAHEFINEELAIIFKVFNEHFS